jgi:hypothetical protein
VAHSRPLGPRRRASNGLAPTISPPHKKAPAGAFLRLSLMYFYSGQLTQFYSGVDIRWVARAGLKPQYGEQYLEQSRCGGLIVSGCCPRRSHELPRRLLSFEFLDPLFDRGAAEYLAPVRYATLRPKQRHYALLRIPRAGECALPRPAERGRREVAWARPQQAVARKFRGPRGVRSKAAGGALRAKTPCRLVGMTSNGNLRADDCSGRAGCRCCGTGVV